MELGSVFKNGKKLRRGYTTGSCAAAAAKAAVKTLYTGEKSSKITINTPAGIQLNLPLVQVEVINENVVTCCVEKDAGDDPDITNRIHIYAEAKKIKQGIILKGGKGVGVVTLPGLAVKVGEPAINPVPRQMIIESVKEVLPNNKGVEITISIPKGEEIAKKTFNPKLGIEGGISILGTTGIVEPMSEEALKETLNIELKMLVKRGYDKVVFTPGNYGEKFITDLLNGQKLPLIKVSNYIGYILEEAVYLNFKKILLVGDIGKLIKVSAGIFNTHSKVADARMEIMAAYAALFGGKKELINQILHTNTTVSVINLLQKNNIDVNEMYRYIADKITKKAYERTHGEVEIGTILFSNAVGLLSKDKFAEKMIEEFKRNE